MICNTRLSLSLLGSSGESTTPNDSTIHQHNNKRKSNEDQELDINPLPSLTLCLSSSAVNSSVISATVSSFSNSSVKRERDASFEEEVELDTNKVIISPKLDDVDQEQDEDHEFGTRKKLRLNKEQSAILEDSFKEHSTLNSKQKRDLATRLSLRPRQVEVWFQNRRARTKLKQTEVDCEILRKCYEDLKVENRRLNTELQELKSLKMAAPFRVQLSAATLSMCPSCERTYGGGSGGDNSATKISFSIGDQKPNFYGSFANSSAALLS
ncbi:homeobox-leucine zipper protein HAT22-like [Nicotiana tabacum]|uniref:Homeobox-leucine zipper protein HAT22-like n=1 Tax=Nicotiana tabacum TaxID=4097 RepID=A0A1S4B2W3_TOBAC|nr:PREDICTED: homeobox-leucine zipper protein HAT22-like [Nicotiana tabacum]